MSTKEKPMDVAKAKSALHDLVFDAENGTDVLDAFCFVVGYTSGELKRRISMEEDEEELKSLNRDLVSINAAWKAFRDTFPPGTCASTETNGRLAQSQA